MNTQRYIAWRFLHPDQNSACSFAERLLDKVRLHAATDLDIEAPGRSTAARGAKVDFQTG
ncbi:MAG TPA: hypothetical protein VI260_13725 [Blastocatellia bacterium]|jgi:hypothetical protein